MVLEPGETLATTLAAGNTTGGSNINMSSTDSICRNVGNADGVRLESNFAGSNAIFLSASGPGGGINSTASSGIINIDSGIANANAITINASNAAGGINVDAGTGGIDIATTGTAADSISLTAATGTGGITLETGTGGVNIESGADVTLESGGTGAVVLSGVGANSSHLRSTQTVPPSVDLGSSLSGVNLVAGSSDVAGAVTYSSINGTGTAIITFNQAYPTAPNVIVTPRNGAPTVTGVSVASNTTNFIYTATDTGVNAQSFFYYVIGN